ncbi:MAG: hypothetical protein O6705_03775 [Actinobacteria bacterium]|nr:hypothetical protein [Actinomycetota bacterium]
MSDSSDYQGEMFAPLSISDTDAEALMTGADGVRSDLADLADVLGSIRTAGQAFGDTDISRLARTAALEARALPAARLDAAQAAARSEWMARMAPRVAVGALALIMLVVSSTGLALAANGAKPGDMLYGLDRAAEVLGIGDGGANERIAEAHALVASGAVAGGLTHAAAVLPATPENDTAKAAIQKAATRVQGEPQGPSAFVAEQVGTLLSYLRLATAAGTVNTSTLAGFAEAIGEPPATPPGQDGTPGQGGNAPGQSEDATGQQDDGLGNSDNVPGPPDNVPGPPVPGPPDEVPGPPDEVPGPPDEVPGPPDEVPGPPDNTPGATNPGGGRS